MKRLFSLLILAAQLTHAQKNSDTLVLNDIKWDTSFPAGFDELQITSNGSLLQGFIYTANGNKKHPTLILLHGYPGNERNLDLAQVLRERGWNVVYFDYRGSWGSQGEFSFKNCVEDVVNVVAFCKTNANKYHIDTSQFALFGHSMGGWVCLQSLRRLPEIKKGFVLSAWDIYSDVHDAISNNKLSDIEKTGDDYFVLNKKSGKLLFQPVLVDDAYFNLKNAANELAQKQIIMLDESSRNKELAHSLQIANHNYFNYEVWNTDHPFSNKRIALIKKVIEFLNK